MSYYSAGRCTYLFRDDSDCEPPEHSCGTIYCEVCDTPVPAADAAPDGLCFECYADRLIDELCDRDVRNYISHNRSDFINYLRCAV
ncbi:MAG: hypothetical protein ACI4J5_03790 [Oscillospiraceae bacterium]